LALGGGSRVEVDDPTGRGVGASADECDTENRRDGVSRRVTTDGPAAPYDRASPMGNATARSGRASESWRGRRVVTQWRADNVVLRRSGRRRLDDRA
jgi:hypothetical protein